MLHESPHFLSVLESTAARTGFPLYLLEKDYYLTILLIRMGALSSDLVFKGGTCLNKVYFSYFRLSEDLDFSMDLPKGNVTRKIRQDLMQPIKEKMGSFLTQHGLQLENQETAGRNESTQYVYVATYPSMVTSSRQSIKIEIGLRNPLRSLSVMKPISHLFLHPFTDQPLLVGGEIRCMDLKEAIAEKMRAAATRPNIAIRDFYDLGYLLRQGVNFEDTQIWDLFKIKLAEDHFENDFEKYGVHFGRSDDEIRQLFLRVETELMDVLTPDEKTQFDLRHTLETFNRLFENQLSR